VARESLEGRLYLSGKIQKEEDTTGFLSRMLDYRSNDSRKQLIELLGSTSGRFAWSLPSRLETARVLFPSGLPDINSLIDGHTRYPLFAPFLDQASRKRLYMHHRRKGYAEAASGFGMDDRARFGICLKCVQEDLNRTKAPFTYWRRGHLIPGIAYCVVHQEVLHTFCKTCEYGHRRNDRSLSPRVRCLCGKALRRIAVPKRQSTETTLLEIDTMAVELMQGRCPIALEPGTIPELVRGHMLRHEPSAKFRILKEVTKRLEDALDATVIESLNIGEGTILRLLGRAEDGTLLINPRQNIALAYAIFGGWDGLRSEADLRKSDVESYENACRYVAKRIRSVEPHRKSEVLSRFERLDDGARKKKRCETRKFIRDALAQNSHLSRRQLYDMPGGRRHWRFALFADSDWFEKMIPSDPATRRARVAQSSDVVPKYMKLSEEEATRISESIYELCNLLVELYPLKRITRTRLLNNTKNESIKGWADGNPIVKEALDACIDSDDDYVNRRIAYICEKVREICITHPYGFSSTYVDLTEQQVKRRIERAMTWLRKNSV
jgi:hypothetical protein